MEATQRSKKPHDAFGGARPLGRIVRSLRAARVNRVSWLIGVVATACALVVLAWLERSVSTGLRIYVIGHIFKVAWAATAALGAAVLAASLVGIAADAERPASLPPLANAARAAVAFVTGIAALGAMLPDWSAFSCAVAGAVIALWAGAIVITSRGGRRLSNE